jgi:hypothetical protein
MPSSASSTSSDSSSVTSPSASASASAPSSSAPSSSATGHRVTADLQADQWITKWSGGAPTLRHYLSAFESLLREDMVVILRAMSKTKFKACARVALGEEFKGKMGEPGSTERNDAILRLREHQRALQQEQQAAEGSEDGKQEEGSVSPDEEEGERSDDEVTTEGDVSPSPSISLSSPPTSSRRSSLRKHAVSRRLVEAEPHLSDDEFEDVQGLLCLPASRVSRRMLQGLSDAAQRHYQAMREEQSTLLASSTSISSSTLGPSTPPPTLPVMSLPASRTGSYRGSSASVPTVTFPAATHSPPTDRESARQLLRDSAPTSASPSAGRSAPGLSSPAHSDCRLILQRHGVPDDLAEVAIFDHILEEVQGGSFEHWWSARQPQIMSRGASVYYEGLLLSLILDYRHRPEVWIEMAARRWMTLHLISSGLSWQEATAFLPLTSRGGLPSSLLFSAQRFAKANSALSSFTNSASSPSQRSSGGGNRQGRDRRQRRSSPAARERSKSRGRDSSARNEGRETGGLRKTGKSNKSGTAHQRSTAEGASAEEQ